MMELVASAMHKGGMPAGRLRVPSPRRTSRARTFGARKEGSAVFLPGPHQLRVHPECEIAGELDPAEAVAEALQETRLEPELLGAHQAGLEMLLDEPELLGVEFPVEEVVQPPEDLVAGQVSEIGHSRPIAGGFVLPPSEAGLPGDAWGEASTLQCADPLRGSREPAVRRSGLAIRPAIGPDAPARSFLVLDPVGYAS